MKVKAWKKLLSATMMVSMVTMLAACGGQKTADSAENTETVEATETNVEDQATETNVEDQGEANTEVASGEKHPCRIVQPGSLPADYETAIAAVNKKLEEDGVDIEVEVIRIPGDAFTEKVNLMMSTGEEFEILHVMQDVKNISSIASMGAIIPVTDYIDKYPNLKARFTDPEWASTLYEGEYYAIPDAWRALDQNVSFMVYREDILNAAGYDKLPETAEEMIDVMKKSQELILEENGIKAYHWFHTNSYPANWLHRTYDTFPFYVDFSLGLTLVRQDGTIDSFYESEEFKKDCEIYYEMYQAGLINPDVLNMDSDSKYDDANYGAFLPSQTFDPNITNTIKENTGIDASVKWTRFVPDKPDLVYTFGQNMNAVSATAEDPETAFKFFDWLYASQENFDLFHYGIEGVHYTLNDEGRMTQVKGEDGNPLYYMDTWITGYVPYQRYTEDATDDYIDYDTYKSDNYVVTPVAGFVFDATNVQTELTNLETEIISSIYPMKLGLVPYEENIDAAITKLKAAGLDKYLEEYRRQFAEYLEKNPDVIQ